MTVTLTDAQFATLTQDAANAVTATQAVQQALAALTPTATTPPPPTTTPPPPTPLPTPAGPIYVPTSFGTYDGMIQVLPVNGRKMLCNGAGLPLDLTRGMNLSGLEVSAIKGGKYPWSFAGWPGTQYGEPDWAFLKSKGVDLVRIPLNAASFLNLTVADTVSTPVSFMTAPVKGSTGGTLTSAWTGEPGSYPLNFNNNLDPSTLAVFQTGSTAVIWESLSANAPSVNANVVTWGPTRQADCSTISTPDTIIRDIKNARQQGIYLIYDWHWSAPQLTFGQTTNWLAPMGQAPTLDEMALAASKAFNQLLASRLGPGGSDHNPNFGGASGYGDVIEDAFNEPYANGLHGNVWTDATLSTPVASKDAALLTGAYGAYVSNHTQNNGGQNGTFRSTWRIVGYQEFIDQKRAINNGIVLLGGNQYCQNTKNYLAYKPNDPTGQHGFTGHLYPDNFDGAPGDPTTGKNPYPYLPYGPYPKSGTDLGNSPPSPLALAGPESILIAGDLFLIGERGGLGGTVADVGEPAVDFMNRWTAQYKVPNCQWGVAYFKNEGAAKVLNSIFWLSGTTLVPSQGAGEVYCAAIAS